jgi:undecaprenyl-diphosphatase
MDLSNNYLFELINAGSHPPPLLLFMAKLAAQWLVLTVPVAWAILWLRGDQRARMDLLYVLVSALIALGIAQGVGMAYPSPRPFALHLGNQYIAHADDPGLPSDHVTLLWSLALASLGTTRGSWLVFPLLAAGLVVGWARVYLGVHFPFDVLAALPVAGAGAGLARVMCPGMERLLGPLTARYDGWQRSALRLPKRD